MNSNSSVELTKIAKSMELKNLTPDVDISSIVVTTPDINRPALQLTGYFEHFASERVQIVGYVEFTYLEHMTRNQRVHAYEQFCAHKVPCIIFTSKTDPDEDILRIATENGIPVFTTEKNTSPFMAEIIRWLNVELAPCISIHGVRVDVYGEGVLIMGESGIGKSEAALELIKKNTQTIDLVIKLEEWDKDKEYDRLGLQEEYTEFLGNRVVCHSIPIRPGRSLAVIVESAAVNHRQKKMGYNAAQELYNRVQKSLAKKKEEQKK